MAIHKPHLASSCVGSSTAAVGLVHQQLHMAQLSAEIEAFQKTITAPRPFAAVSDLIADASEKVAIHANPINDTGKKPVTFGELRSFCASFDVSQFGIGRDSIVCTAIPNGPEAAVCFWAISKQCVFAPLNPALTSAEVEFELTDLPCHTMILMEGDDSLASKQIVEACANHNVSVLRLVPDAAIVGLFTLRPEGAVTPVRATETSKSDLALVLHTSGTTKKPKIVPLTHSNLGHGIQFVASTLNRKPGDLYARATARPPLLLATARPPLLLFLARDAFILSRPSSSSPCAP